MEKISQTRLHVIGIRINSEVHSSDNYDITALSDSDTDSIDCQTTVPVVHRFTEGPSGS